MDFNKLWQNFLGTVQNHYMDFNGRIGRAQFWYFILVCVIVSIAAAIVDVFFAVITGYVIVSMLVGLALVLPMGGMAARRVQDVGQNGQLVWIWVGAYAASTLLRLVNQFFVSRNVVTFSSTGVYYSSGIPGSGLLLGLLGLIMLVASVALIYFCAQPGQPGDNQYGPPPAPWTPN
jgi:uncharacterized membrane protein YhaH (DUF805 family)